MISGQDTNLPKRYKSRFENPPPFNLLRPPRQRVPFVFNSPHSGRHYPQSFIDASLLDKHAIRQSEDFLVDELFCSVLDIGIPILCANYARAYLDVNREAFELDAKMFDDKLPGFANTGSIRVAGGLGTVARIVADNQEIYRGKLDVDEVIERIERLYKPYHRTLEDLMDETRAAFGYGVLVDCHSMPSNGSDYFRRNRPDFVIGDRYGTSADSEIVHLATQILRDLGYKVAVNKPYAGGFITEHYGRPKDGFHALQIEINRGIYMDEKTLSRGRRFDRICQDMAEFAGRLVLVSEGRAEDRYSSAAE